MRCSNRLTLIWFYTFCCILLRIVHSCMPGYDSERARLRQYLGIEWIPGGLTKMDTEQPRFVRQASDLNCDFSKPEKCKWQNIQKGNGLDSLDFHLFKKEDHAEFPALQLRPGPSKVPVGDLMLLTGDRKRQEQSAILSSHPIKCQNTTGRLTVSFWLYNGARLEVLILGDQDESLMPLPEKPQLDCGTVQVNTECTALIPPSEKPFRIGLRAYDIRNPEGSLVMLDNFLYEAEFCKLSIDFGPAFSTEPLMTGATGEFVASKEELSCSDFGASCQWRNLGHGETGIWQRAVGEVPSMLLFKETGGFLQPTLPAAFLYIQENGKSLGFNQPHTLGVHDSSTEADFRILVSDPIRCEKASTIITLKFRIWSTKGIKLSCCLMEPRSMNMLGPCQPIPSGISPAPVQLDFPLAGSEFMLAFRVDPPVNMDFDNFVFLDQIEMVGPDGCGQQVGGENSAGKNWLSDGKFYTAPMLSTLLDRPIHSPKELSCDFSKRALNCQWTNLERIGEGMSLWEIGILESNSKSTLGKQQQKFLPAAEGDVALTKMGAKGSAVLLSERIHCTLDDPQGNNAASLSFRSWLTQNSRLGVCIVAADSLEVLDCQSTSAAAAAAATAGQDNGEQIFVEIPRLDLPFRLAFRAETGDQGGVVAVDDINFQGNICSLSNVAAFSSKSGHGHVKQRQYESERAFSGYDGGDEATAGWHSVPDENVCRLISCNFEHEGNMCLYESKRVASSVSMFRNANRTAFVMLFTRSRVAMLESPLFHLNTHARLHFDYSISKGPANLHICHDSVSTVLDSCFTIENQTTTVGWKHDFVEVLPSDRKLYFIVKLEGPGKASIQLDNVQLTDVSDHAVC